MDEITARTYTEILHDELKMAMGCTEPIAIAYCAAYAKQLLGKMPETCDVFCSGNIIKNVKAVTVPQTGGLKGIEVAALAGILGGDAEKELQVLSSVTDEDRAEIRRWLSAGIVRVHVLDSKHLLHIITVLRAGADEVSVEIVDGHTTLGDVVRNGETLHTRKQEQDRQSHLRYDLLNIYDILQYADMVDLHEVSPVLENQLQKNNSIALEGLTNDWGAEVGKTLLQWETDGIWTRAKAMAAAGSDARMNGCAMPVVINSGSGNQGLTVSLPVKVYLPMIQDEIDRAIRRASITDPKEIRLRLEDSQLPDEVDVLLDMKYETLSDLNELAEVTDGLSEADMEKLGAVVMLAEPKSAAQIKNLVESLDLFDLAPGAHTPEDYGKYMIQQSGRFDYDENLDAFYDYEKYGTERMNEEDGMFTDRGYIAYKG